jgi:glycosyltransferase involved in cell wall biosynthesis
MESYEPISYEFNLPKDWSAGKKKVAAIIPAYNEEKTIGSVVLKTKASVDEVLVVDDGSIDDTALLAESAGATVLKMPQNSGKAAALLSGLDVFVNNGVDAVVLLDADGQHDPRQIPQLLQPILDNEADLVIGSRFLEGGKGIPHHRKVGQTILNKTTSFGAGIKITDSQSGFRALSRKALQNLDFDSQGYDIETDMIGCFADRGLRIAEVPIAVEYDVPNGHKKAALPHGMGVLNAAVGLIGYRRPLLLFGVPGFMLFMMGMLLGLLSISHNYILGWGWFFESMTAVTLVIIGIILIIGGLTLNSLVALMRSSRTRI